MHPSPRRHTHPFAKLHVVLVRPRYPENLGAVARAMRVTGFDHLVLVSPHPLASPTHENARKLAVGSEDILDRVVVRETLEQALDGMTTAIATTARRGISGVHDPRQLPQRLLPELSANRPAALVFGGERAGLRRHEVAVCSVACRIPMVANEPSLNLAQAVMIVLYELMVAGLDSNARVEP